MLNICIYYLRVIGLFPFIKSIRGSDPNAAVYWLARMIEAGEDIAFIARRMLILAAEDIGISNPTALVLANNTIQAVTTVGYPDTLKSLFTSSNLFWINRKKTRPRRGSLYTAAVSDEPSLRASAADHSSLSISLMRI